MMNSHTPSRPLRRRRWSAFVLIAALVLAACGTGTEQVDPAADAASPGDTETTGADGDTPAPTADGEPLKIGVMNPFSGAFAVYGEQLYRGYQMAVDEANANGGVMGRQVTLAKGDALTPDQAIPEAERLATQEDVDLFIGTYVSAVSNAASDVANQYDKLYWDTNALATDLTERGLPNFIRVGPSAEDFAATSAEAIQQLVADQLGKDVSDLVVWLEHEESIYGTSIAEIQQERLEEAGVTIAGVGAHAAGAADLTDAILRAKAEDPDVWVQTGYVSDTNLLLRTARDQGFEPGAILLVGTGDTSETPEALGDEYLDGVLMVTYPWAPLPESYGPGSQEFLDTYVDTYGEEPIAAQVMTAYVGMKVLLEALEQAQSVEPAAVREAAASLDHATNSYANGFGVKFNENFQNTLAKPVITQWQSGERATVYPPEAAGDTEVTDLAR